MSLALVTVPGPRRPLKVSEAVARVAPGAVRSAILVEGWSDEAAVEAWARVCGVGLAERGVVVLPMGGITNLQKFAAALIAPGLGVTLSGLYDVSEARLALRCLDRAGVGTHLTRAGAEQAGFFGCDTDLEDELIRALGPAAMERLIDQEGDLESFRRFQAQPAQRGRDAHPQLKRFMGTRAGRKIHYGSRMVECLAPGDVPAPLRRVLSHSLNAAA